MNDFIKTFEYLFNEIHLTSELLDYYQNLDTFTPNNPYSDTIDDINLQFVTKYSGVTYPIVSLEIKTFIKNYGIISQFDSTKNIRELSLEIPARVLLDVSDLVPLKKLSRLFIKYSCVESLQIKPANLASLSNFENLCELSLNRINLSKEKLSGIFPRSLQALDLANTFISNLNWIEPNALPALKTLNVRSNRLKLITQLGNVPSLTELNLSQNGIQNLEPLNQMVNLLKLNIFSIISTYSPHTIGLYTAYPIILPKLTDLVLGQFEHWVPIRAINLKSLEISNASNDLERHMDKISEYEGGFGFDIKNLKELTITNANKMSTPGKTFTIFSQFANLTHLSVPNTNLVDIRWIRKFTNLKSLNISSNKKIKNMEIIGQVSSLEYLDCSSNDVSNIEFISNLTKLKELRLVSNKIIDISPLAGLINLQCLNLSYNGINDITPIKSLGNLEHIFLFNNNIDTIEPLKELENIRTIMITGNYIKTIRPLINIKSLGDLFIGELILNDTSDILKEFDPSVNIRAEKTKWKRTN